MDSRQNDKHESKRVNAWLTTEEVVDAIGGSKKKASETIEETTQTTATKTKLGFWARLKLGLKQKKIQAWLWFDSTIVADFLVTAGIYFFFRKTYPDSMQLVFVQFCLSFLAYVAVKDMFADWGPIRKALLFLFVLVVDIFLLVLPPFIMEGLVNATKIDDLYRMVTINFTILTANCAIPAFVVSKGNRRGGLSEYESKTYTQLILFMIGAVSIASLLFAMLAKNDANSIKLAGSFEYFYCFTSIMLSGEHFFLIFPHFHKAIGVMYDDAHPTTEPSDRKDK